MGAAGHLFPISGEHALGPAQALFESHPGAACGRGWQNWKWQVHFVEVHGSVAG